MRNYIMALAAAFLAACGGGGGQGSGPQTYTVGGTVAGLGNANGLTLSDGTESLAISAGATSFIFPMRLGSGATYSITVTAQPPGEACTVASGSGAIGAANVTNAVVTCSDQSYTVGGTISGLTVSGLVLANGSDTLNVPVNASAFTLPTAIAFTNTYTVTVKTQPTNFTCTVNNGSGTLGASPVTSVMVTCKQTAFTVGGSISGLTTSGLVLANGGDTVNVLANAATFTLPTAIANGASYDVTVRAHPTAVNCTVSNGSGSVSGTNVTQISAACTPGTESVLYSFAGVPSDGATSQYADLLQARDGYFYGVTEAGGANSDGTVFKIDSSGKETVLWSFSGTPSDGSVPYGGLIQGSDGNLYGMTTLGGQYGGGTVFQITPGGQESVLWSFGSGSDGSSPIGKVIQANDGNFYGSTESGGTNGFGTVFRLTPTGSETVLWSFTGQPGDGSSPNGGLLQATDGNLYGMASTGGAYNGGTIFQISLAGGERTLYSFGITSTDGTEPEVGTLTQASDGNMYGVTYLGGANNSGTVFKITLSGTESVLWSFGGTSADGKGPLGRLLQANDGNLYGLTGQGGTNSWGTLYQLTLSGRETVLWSFGSGVDGQLPTGSLIQGNDGTLYGVTDGGGSNRLGTVFKFN